ncbi:MAG: hypothetical protein K1X89_28475 [Myxococcaceae bacterium]|nr:hypothetical protein [Myxococcaceae bacterium]
MPVFPRLPPPVVVPPAAKPTPARAAVQSAVAQVARARVAGFSGVSSFEAPAKRAPALVLDPSKLLTAASGGTGGAKRLTADASSDPAAAAKARVDDLTSDPLLTPDELANAAATDLAAHQDDPAYVAAYVAALKAAGKLDAVVGWTYGDPAAQQFSSTAAQKAAVASAIDVARQSGGLSDTDIRASGAGSNGAAWVAANAASAHPVDRVGPSDSPAIDTLASAKDEYDHATEAVKEADAQLEKELAALPNGLTDAQKQAYIAEYHRRHADVYDAQVTAAQHLAQALADPALEDAAIRDPQTAKLVFESEEALASTGQAKGTLTWLATLADPNSEIFKAYAALYPDLDARLGAMVEQAVPAAAGQLLVEHQGDADAAIADLETLLGPLEGMTTLAGAKGDGAKVWDALKRGAHGELGPLQGLMGDVAGMSPLEKGLTAAGLLFSAAELGTGAANQDYLLMVAAFAALGEEGLDLISTAVKGYAESGKLVAMLGEGGAEAAEGVSRWAKSFVPGLGLIASAAMAAVDLRNLKNDPSIGKVVMVVGDAIAVMGGAFNCIPGGQEAGEAIVFVGNVIAAVGQLVDALEASGETRKEIREILESDALAAAGFNPDAVDGYAKKGQDLKALDGLGLTPEQTQVFAAEFPDLCASGLYLGAIVAAGKALGLEGQAFIDWMRQLGPERASELASVFLDLQSIAVSNGEALSAEAVLAQLDPDEVPGAAS